MAKGAVKTLQNYLKKKVLLGISAKMNPLRVIWLCNINPNEIKKRALNENVNLLLKLENWDY